MANERATPEALTHLRAMAKEILATHERAGDVTLMVHLTTAAIQAMRGELDALASRPPSEPAPHKVATEDSVATLLAGMVRSLDGIGWGEFKAYLESKGVSDTMKVEYIDVSRPDLCHEMSTPHVAINETDGSFSVSC